MRTVILFILTLTITEVAGQTHLFGIKGGINWTNITSSNFPNGNDYRTGITSGLTYEYVSQKHLSVGADIIYNQRGFSFTLLDNLGNRTDSGPRAKFNYNYLSIPFKTGLSYGRKLYTFVNVGVVPSFLIDAKTISPKFDASGIIIGSETIDVTSRVAKFDVAGLLEAGGGYKIANKYSVFIAFAYQHSLTSITNSEYFANSKIRHNGYSITVGLKRSLTRK